MKRKVIDDVHDVALLSQQSSWPLVTRILRIQQLGAVEAKSFEWMRDLRCLSPRGESVSGPSSTKLRSQGGKLVLDEVTVSTFDADVRRFVIISYPWHASRFEDPTYGAYTINKLDGKRKKSRVRNTIMRRIISYVEAHDLKGFWIDRQCINQGNKTEKSRAMRSMDRLYALFPRSVGMLSTCVDQQWKVDSLRQLMEGTLVEQTASNDIRLASQLPFNHWKLIRFFVRLASDQWWHRCWIFQEEYCAGTTMLLLIPCTSGLFRKTSIFGDLPNELEVGATQLRHQLTRFVLACCDDQRFNEKQRSFLHRRLLQRTERYRTTFEYGYRQGRTLSSIIVADVLKRDITKREDLLPIIANCCNYSIRLDPEIIKTRKISLSLALLTQALLNGEVLFNKRGYCAQLKRPFSQFFQRQILGRIQPPPGQMKLTFLKHIRFQHVELLHEGISTSGYLWRIVGALKFARRETLRHLNSKHKGWTDLDRDQAILQELTALVRSQDEQLGVHMEQFVDELDCLSAQQKEPGARHEYMLAMARDVSLAIEQGRPVYIGKIDRYEYCRAIFVAESKKSPAPRATFTSLHDVEDELLRDSRERLPKHVSFEVDVEGSSVRHLHPLLRIQKWINGLCFFEKSAEQRVIFPWPDAIDTT